MKKKVVALLLSCAMVLSLAACGQKEEAATETPAPEATEENVEAEAETEEIAVDAYAGTELDIAILRSSNDKAEDFNEKEIIKKVEEATGIHVNWTIIAEDGKAEKVGAMLASGNQPDAYISLIDEATLVGDLSLFYDMSGLLEQYAPDAYRIHEENGLLPNITFPDGKIYNLYTGPAIAYKNTWAKAPQVINQDWLDALGLSAPTTKEELKEVLIAFRDNDPNGNGKKDEIPLSFCSGLWDGEFLFFANNFGISGQGSQQQEYYKKLESDGTITAPIITDEFRAFLEFYNELYEEGLIDMEGFSQTSDQYYAKVNGNQVGVCVKFSLQREDEAKEAGAPYFLPFYYQGLEDVDICVTGCANTPGTGRFGFVPSADADIEPLLHWWNYMHSTKELRILAHNGTSRVVEVDGEYYSANYPVGHEIENPTTEQYTTESLWNSSPVYPPEEELQNDPRFENPINPRLEYTANVIIPNGWLQDTPIPTKFVDASAIEERAFIEVELFDRIYSGIADFVMNGVTDASWDAYKAELDSLGYGDWIQWWQDYMDGNL